MTQTHALFLEWFAISEATKAGRYTLENGNTGARPHTPAPLEADCHEIHETAATLLATMGQPVFEPLMRPNTDESEKELFYCKRSGAQGVGEYTTEGFVVLKGSRCRREQVVTRTQQQLINEGVLIELNGMLEFTRSYLSSSPSQAAVVLIGRASNGWIEWKTIDGRTLDAVKRQVVETT